MVGLEKWSATRINIANYCRMRYYLTYVDPDKPSPLILSAYIKGSCLHRLIEGFWKKLGTEEEVANKKKKYSNAEEFAKYSQKQWMRRVIAAENSGQEIDWRYENEKWEIRAKLPGICMKLYERFIEEGKPLYTEKKFRFVFEGIIFSGYIDDIRLRNGNVIVRDFKSGRPFVGEMKLEKDPQLTLYSIGICKLCSADREFARTLGLEDEVEFFKEQSEKGIICVSPKIIAQFFMIEPDKTGRLNIFETTRKGEDFYDILRMIAGMRKDANEGNIFPEWGRKCDDCNMKKVCKERAEANPASLRYDKRGQGYLDFAIPSFAKPVELGEDKRQKRFRYRYQR